MLRGVVNCDDPSIRPSIASPPANRLHQGSLLDGNRRAGLYPAVPCQNQSPILFRLPQTAGYKPAPATIPPVAGASSHSRLAVLGPRSGDIGSQPRLGMATSPGIGPTIQPPFHPWLWLPATVVSPSSVQGLATSAPSHDSGSRRHPASGRQFSHHSPRGCGFQPQSSRRPRSKVWRLRLPATTRDRDVSRLRAGNAAYTRSRATPSCPLDAALPPLAGVSQGADSAAKTPLDAALALSKLAFTVRMYSIGLPTHRAARRSELGIFLLSRRARP